MSEDGKPMRRCAWLTVAVEDHLRVTVRPRHASTHRLQVKGGGIKVCDGVLDKHIFDALVADLHRRNTLVDCSGHCATGSTKDALFLVNKIWPVLRVTWPHCYDQSQSVLFTTQT